MSKDWVLAVQRIVFNSVTLDVRDWKAAVRHRDYLDFLESRPHISKFVRTLEIHSPIVSPNAMHRRFPSAFPGITTLNINTRSTMIDVKSVASLISDFAYLRHLVLSNGLILDPAIQGFPTLTLTALQTLSFSGSCELTAHLLAAVALSSSKTTIQGLSLEYLDCEATSFVRCQHIISTFPSLQTLSLKLGERQRRVAYATLAHSNIALKNLPKLYLIHVEIYGVTDVTVAILRRMFAVADLPALRTLKLKISGSSSAGAIDAKGLFRPFASDTTAAAQLPVLSEGVFARLQELHISLARGLTVHSMTKFLSLFGIVGRPGAVSMRTQRDSQ